MTGDDAGTVPRRIAEELHANRDFQNEGLRAYCLEHQVPLVDIASKLRDEHFGDELHPNDAGAQLIAEVVFWVLNDVAQAAPTG